VQTQIYEKYDALLHGSSRSRCDKIVSVHFMKKYIHVAKLLKPVLTREAAEAISEEYSRLRSHDAENSENARTQPVTVRALETLIRLATAHAKIRLAAEVIEEDAQAAIELVQFAYFKKVLEKSKKRQRARSDGEEKKTRKTKKAKKDDPYDIDGVDDDDDDDDDDEDGQDGQKQDAAAPSQTKKSSSKSAPAEEAMEVDDENADGVGTITDIRLELFKKHLFALLKEEHAQSIPVVTVMNYLKEKQTEIPFTRAEVNAALANMDSKDEVMVSEGVIFLI